eukprot:TRINITY_DN669_c0_g1_i2.p1 TRINITY_DN669_c0_g1~~TRINITY_DN669_c0_g1_i2.p1  ORF type:complete len:233 (+),score=16.56 TRINITY_DN669_c0_g1_i2:274-972(+)
MLARCKKLSNNQIRCFHNRVPRHFVAIVPPTGTLDAIEDIQSKLKKKLEATHIKWVKRDNLHITLRFFGAELNSQEKLDLAVQAMNEVASQMPAFDIELEKLGTFPKMKKPRVLWLGIGEGSGKIKSLTSNLENAWKRLGISPSGELSVVPHITLGRWSDISVKTVEGDLTKETIDAYIQPISKFAVKDILLLDSSLEAESPVYTPVHLSKLNYIEPVRKRTKYKFNLGSLK